MNLLNLTRFGNPILRERTQRLSVDDIHSPKIQRLIADIRHTNEQKQYGVGLAAPQVGEPVALSVIGIKPTPNRPDLERFDCVVINPEYIGVGRRMSMWEGCQSSGVGNDTLYAKVLRYRKVQAKWHDESGKLHNEELTGFVAHVFQHETDHLNGILFVDKVRDTTTYMMADEFRKRIVSAK